MELSRPNEDIDEDEKRHKSMENHDNWRVIDRSMATVLAMVSADKRGYATTGRDDVAI